MAKATTNHSNPAEQTYRPHPYVRLVNAARAIIELEHRVERLEQTLEDRAAGIVFKIVANLPPPNPHPSPMVAAAREIGGPTAQFVMGLNNCNGKTNSCMKTEMLEHPNEFLLGLGVYAASLAVASVSGFVSHQTHVHVSTGDALGLPPPARDAQRVHMPG